MLSVAAVQLRSAVVPVRVPDSVDAEGAVVSAVPVPLTGIVTTLPLESVTVSDAALLPDDVGLNWTPISHPPSGSTVTPVPMQVLLGPILNCSALAPVILAEAMVS